MRVDQRKIIEKIAKCLRLSDSANPNEAASALRQARRLMEKYRISEADLELADIQEAGFDTGNAYSPPFWVLALANLVANAFDCRVILARRFGCRPEYRFIGMGHSAEVATYTFKVLLRRLETARARFLAALEDTDDERERRADVFAQAWLFRVARTVERFAGDPRVEASVEAHIRRHYGEVDAHMAEPREAERADFDDILQGIRAADGVALFQPVRRQRTRLLAGTGAA